SIETDDPPIEAGGSQWRQTGVNQGSRLNPSAASSRRRSGGPWSLGGRSAVGFDEQLHRALGRTSQIRTPRRPSPRSSSRQKNSQPHLNKVARRLNERPRETLGFETPAERV